MGSIAGVSLLAGAATVLGSLGALALFRSRAHLSHLSALGAGLLLGAALFTMMPDASRLAPYGMALVAAGFLGMLVLQQFTARQGTDAWAVFLGMLLHSYVEGVLLGAATASRYGWVSIAALCLHKLPEGFSLSAVFAAAGYSRRYTLGAAATVGAAMVAGALSASLWWSAWQMAGGALLSLATGCFLYIGTLGMLPPAPRRQWLHVWLTVLGVMAVHAVSLL
ncbi:MAG TPA: ZIP family metal transporter [Symbiobacteriaceae bacterium]|nr:ZIP family metal transporter [Symbiobacteriaceae bacterium]